MGVAASYRKKSNWPNGGPMMRRLIVAVTLAVFVNATSVRADDGGSSSGARESRTGLWTTVGAGAGFGAGLWFGLRAFDDSINSDRKVWTTAIASAVGGAVVGYLVSRGRANAAPVTSNDRDRRVEVPAHLTTAPRLGSGRFNSWLEGLSGAADLPPRGGSHTSGGK
jgi:hypothetical protein